jgi:hypothetical protein
MTLTIITRPQALAALTDVVADAGRDFVYTERSNGEGALGTCLYWSPVNSGPSCGVGRALSRLGVSDETLRALDEPCYGTAIYSRSSVGILRQAGFVMEPAALGAFMVFQRAQDQRYDWGYALDRAMENATDA